MPAHFNFTCTVYLYLRTRMWYILNTQTELKWQINRLHLHQQWTMRTIYAWTHIWKSIDYTKDQRPFFCKQNDHNNTIEPFQIWKSYAVLNKTPHWMAMLSDNVMYIIVFDTRKCWMNCRVRVLFHLNEIKQRIKIQTENSFE